MFRRRRHAVDEDLEEEEYEDEWEYEEEDEYEEEEDDEFEWSAAWDEDGDGEVSAVEFTTTVSYGVLAMLPLLVGYELALDAGIQSAALTASAPTRSVAEALISTPLAPLGPELSHLVRRSVVGLLVFAALVRAFRHGGALLPRIVRTVAEGALGALLLGPILTATSRAAEPFVGAMVVGATQGVPALARASFVMGGAAYEELVFRVGIMSLAFVMLRPLVGWFGFGRRTSGFFAGAGAVLFSAAIFAMFHTSAWMGWLGPGGESFDLAAFTWRATSGVVLGLVVFWRGVGVAAWAHGLFNLALLIGVRPPSIF